MSLGSRRVRLKAIWLLLIPFAVLARPTPGLLAVGGAVAFLGVVIRAWAAGCIRKDQELATTGPYAHTRNPLYLGSLFIGAGVTLAGGRWYFVVLFLLFFAVIYRRTMLDEEEGLEEEFGDTYRRYREAVPALLPRLTPYVDTGASGREGVSGKSGRVPASGPGDEREPVATVATTGSRERSAEKPVGAGSGDDPAAESGDVDEIPTPGGSAADVRPWRFSMSRYLRNREWEAALGVAAGFAFLAAKMLWS